MKLQCVDHWRTRPTISWGSQLYLKMKSAVDDLSGLLEFVVWMKIPGGIFGLDGGGGQQ